MTHITGSLLDLQHSATVFYYLTVLIYPLVPLMGNPTDTIRLVPKCPDSLAPVPKCLTDTLALAPNCLDLQQTFLLRQAVQKKSLIVLVEVSNKVSKFYLTCKG